MNSYGLSQIHIEMLLKRRTELFYHFYGARLLQFDEIERTFLFNVDVTISCANKPELFYCLRLDNEEYSVYTTNA